ncbi:MAG: glycosyltransferase family 2 protein [Pseudomonadota bacterium]
MRLLITTMKDEGPFILEWVAYHQSIGFTHFLVATNDCSDGTDAIWKRLEALGIAAHIDNPGPWDQGPQASAYDRAMAHPWFKEAEWIFVADADEFLNIHVGDGTLDAVFQEVPDANAISFNWLLFGHGGRERFEERFVTEEFTQSAHPLQIFPDQLLAFKTLFRADGPFEKINTHRPKLKPDASPEDLNWVDADGMDMGATYAKWGWKMLSNGVGFGTRLGRVHHYAVKSAESYLIKRLRGDVAANRWHHKLEESGRNYWAIHNWNLVETPTILPRLPAAREAFARLIADPKLADLHRDAAAWHRDQIAALRDTDAGQGFLAFAKSPMSMRFLRLADLAVAMPRKIVEVEKFNPATALAVERQERIFDLKLARKHGRRPWFALGDALDVAGPEEVTEIAAPTIQEGPRVDRRRRLRARFLQDIAGRKGTWLACNLMDLEAIEDLVRNSDAEEVILIAPWGFRADRYSYPKGSPEADPRFLAADQAYLSLFDRFGDAIAAGRLRLIRGEARHAVRLIEPETIDVAYLSGVVPEAQFDRLVERLIGLLKPGGRLAFDHYHRKSPRGPHMVASINKMIAARSETLRADAIEGAHLAVSRLKDLAEPA